MIELLAGRTDIDPFTEKLGRVCLIDVGTIVKYDQSTGKGDVNLYMIRQGVQKKLTNIEILSVGNSANGLWSSMLGAPCLVFFPRTVVPSVRDGLTKINCRMYEESGAKALPLATLKDTLVNVGFDSLGQFVAQNKNIVLCIGQEGITLRDADANHVYEFDKEKGLEKVEGGGKIINHIDNDGNIEVQYRDDNGLIMYRMSFSPTTGNYLIQRGAYEALTKEQEADPSTYTDYKWTTLYEGTGTITETLQLQSDDPTDPAQTKPIRVTTKNIDGSITEVLNDSSDTTKPLWSNTFGADGSIILDQTNPDGDKLNTVSISASGDITITQTKAENTITLKQDGTLSISTKGDVSVNSKGNATVTTDGNVALQATGTAELTAGSGKKLKAGGNGKTLKDILVTDLLGLLQAFDTAGSPASHTTGPNALTKISQFQQTWATILD